MKKLLVGMFLLFGTMSASGSEWVPYVYQPPVPVQQIQPVVQLIPYYVPVIIQQVPVVQVPVVQVPVVSPYVQVYRPWCCWNRPIYYNYQYVASYRY